VDSHDPLPRQRDPEPPWTRHRLGAVLVSAGVVGEDDLEDALAAQLAATGPRRRLGRVLVDLGLAAEREIAQALADQLRLEVLDLAAVPVSPEHVRLLPRAVAWRLGMVVVSREGRRVTVAASDPTDVVALDDVRLHTGATELTVRVATDTQVRDVLRRVWSLAEESADLATHFEDDADSEDEPVVVADDAPTVRLVTSLLAEAVRTGASDVHVEPHRDAVRVRYRVDGVLRDVMTLPRSAAAQVTSRIKIVSGLDIAERRLPQDGRSRVTVDGRAVEARVSTMPTVHGEKVVIRLLGRVERVPGLNEIGLEPAQLAVLRAAVTAPQGLVLITGPTGAGKTSTLYSALTEIDTNERNVVTLEDPVEVQVPGITQSQVNERAGLTFGRGLRALLRQDPDIVLVGEIRDTETAELATRAALTGHLVLSTLHTTSALAAIIRLVDMGIQPFLVASSLTAVVAQRLVRRPCPDCTAPDEPDPDLVELLDADRDALAAAVPVRGAGCVQCAASGYRGRSGVFEVVEVTAGLRGAIGSGAGEPGLAAAAGPYRTLREVTLARVLAGETTLEEAARVLPRS